MNLTGVDIIEDAAEVATGGFKFLGMGKAVLIAFGIGAATGAIPAGLLVHKLWGGHVAKAEVKRLKGVISERDFALELEREASKGLRKIAEDKDKHIATLNQSNSGLAANNALLAASRAPTYEKTIIQGKAVKDEAAKNDECVTTRVDDKLRAWGNGSDFDPSALFIREENSKLEALRGGSIRPGASDTEAQP